MVFSDMNMTLCCLFQDVGVMPNMIAVKAMQFSLKYLVCEFCDTIYLLFISGCKCDARHDGCESHAVFS